MSARNALLIFLSRDGFDGWLHLVEGRVVARGSGIEGLPPLVDPTSAEAIQVAAVVPGDEVLLHWLEVPPGLAPAQAVAAARLMASEVSAQPVADLHLAVGREAEGESLRCVALVSSIEMAGWIGRLQAVGLDPDIVIPEPLLLPVRDNIAVRYERGEKPLYRSPNDAFSIEPELAEIVLADIPVEAIDDAAFEAGLGQALEQRPVDLRQGPFAKRTRFKIEWKLVRRLTLLVAAILLVTLAVQVATILRYTFAADALERELEQVASRALPGSGRIANAPAQLGERLTALRGSGIGYSALASALFAAVRGTANAQIIGIVFQPDGTLRATMQGDTAATISALAERLRADGFAVDAGPVRSDGGRQVAELTVRVQ